MSNKVTDNEIVKALECCAYGDGCEDCPRTKQCDGAEHLINALDLIIRQKARIENYIELVKESQSQTKTAIEQFDQLKQIAYSQKAEIEILENQIDEKNEEIDRISYALADEVKLKAEIKAEAIKEFAIRSVSALQPICCNIDQSHLMSEILYNLVKEMVGDVQ